MEGKEEIYLTSENLKLEEELATDDKEVDLHVDQEKVEPFTFPNINVPLVGNFMEKLKRMPLFD